jgi:hypothetical protein
MLLVALRLCKRLTEKQTFDLTGINFETFFPSPLLFIFHTLINFLVKINRSFFNDNDYFYVSIKSIGILATPLL